MKDFKSLKILDKFKFIYSALGINYETMRKILKLKLTIDSRRVPSILANQNNKKSNNRESKSNSLQYLYYAFFGIFIGLPILLPMGTIVKMNLILGILIFMLTLTMISDFSYVLLDVRDLSILYPRPIDKNIISAARTTHIMIYLIQVIIPLSAVTLVLGTIKQGVIFFLIMLIELIFIALFAVFITSILYYLILHFFDGEKLKDIINYFQILLSVFMILGYQVGVRVFDFSDNPSIFAIKWWTYLLPSSWFAAPFAIFIDNSFRIEFIILSSIAIIVPLGFLILYNSFIGKNFEQNLIKLNSNTDKVTKLYFIKDNFQRKIANLICSNNIERSFYKFTHTMLSKDRKLKLQIYPTISMSIIFPYLMLFTSLNHELSLYENLSAISQGKGFLYLYYYSLMISIVVFSISYSESFKGAWIYNALPIKDYKSVHKGAYKAFVVNLILPTFLFTMLIFLIFGGFSAFLNIFIILINTLIISMIVYQFANKEPPFSKDINTANSSEANKIGLAFAGFGITLLFWGIHNISISFKYGYIISLLLFLLILIIYWVKFFGNNNYSSKKSHRLT
ncbi:hypothetical protein [Clostridium grantii]|uniref:ABC-2 type transport system permease protein n=1 Tax=Clostridium grantii DSM 8605 TaxID=1121316 RepID=A0A1M5WR90_9CLOT|nr:hypothetical protein [Clostridium grantii]SHH90067.1 hypothetical protein SAMN02745207_03078 [Clostridium grantii DSM 8605]